MQNIKDAIIQVGIVLIVSFIVYLIKNRKAKGFGKWMGLFIPKIDDLKTKILKLILILIIFSVIPIVIVININIANDTNLAYQSIEGGKFLFIGLIFKSLIQTALSEELLFRGLIGKRLVNILGYKKGNIVQSIIFGLVHCFAIITFGYKIGVIMIVIIAFTAYFYGYLMYKVAKGSILLCWLAHGISNLLSFAIFYLIQ
jgi:membrane protease YdiL (CAAX protease family)